MSIFGGQKYPTFPLTPEQEKENRAFKQREGKAEAALARLTEKYNEAVEALGKKYDLPVYSEEGSWYFGGYQPHVARVNVEAMTPEQKVAWDHDQVMRDMMSSVNESLIASMAAFNQDKFLYNQKYPTEVKWVRHEWVEDPPTSGYSQSVISEAKDSSSAS